MNKILNEFVNGFVDAQFIVFAAYGFLVFSYQSSVLIYDYLKKNDKVKSVSVKSPEHEFDQPKADNGSFDSDHQDSSDSEEYFEINRNLRKRQRNSI